MVTTRIAAVAYSVPIGVLTNSDLNREFPEWSVDKISAKTGIDKRHIAGPTDTPLTMGTAAVESLFEVSSFLPQSIDAVIVCSQSAGTLGTSLAGTFVDQLELQSSVFTTDINLGCSGYVYALGLSEALIASGAADRVLVITVDTYSRYINSGDKAVRTIFGDAATASIIERTTEYPGVVQFVYGTDGSGAGNLIVPRGGIRSGEELREASSPDARHLKTNGFDLYMDGPEIFNFTIDVVPEAVGKSLTQAGIELEDVDLFVFHQANRFMLSHLRKKLRIPEEKFFISMGDIGNTVSSSIPIALSRADDQGVLANGMTVMLVGFGVGLSWAAALVTWRANE